MGDDFDFDEDDDSDDNNDDNDKEEPFKVFQFGELGGYWCCWIRERSKHLAKAGEEEADTLG